MPKYVSNDGKWEPAMEEVALTDKEGRPYIYKGKDRAAIQDMEAGNVESRSWYQHPETIAMIRQVHQMSVEEYKKMTGYDEKTTKEEVAKELSKVNTHADLPRKTQKKQRSGGSNTAGNSGHMEGDFGDYADAKIKAS